MYPPHICTLAIREWNETFFWILDNSVFEPKEMCGLISTSCGDPVYPVNTRVLFHSPPPPPPPPHILNFGFSCLYQHLQAKDTFKNINWAIRGLTWPLVSTQRISRSKMCYVDRMQFVTDYRMQLIQKTILNGIFPFRPHPHTHTHTHTPHHKNKKASQTVILNFGNIVCCGWIKKIPCICIVHDLVSHIISRFQGFSRTGYRMNFFLKTFNKGLNI